MAAAGTKDVQRTNLMGTVLECLEQAFDPNLKQRSRIEDLDHGLARHLMRDAVHGNARCLHEVWHVHTQLVLVTIADWIAD
jgi:hypothetical protein